VHSKMYDGLNANCHDSPLRDPRWSLPSGIRGLGSKRNTEISNVFTEYVRILFPTQDLRTKKGTLAFGDLRHCDLFLDKDAIH